MAKETEAKLLLRISAVGSEVLDKTGSALASLGKVATAAFTTISAAVGLAIHNYKEQEEATNTLNQALIRQGIYTKDLSKSYQDMASQLQATTTYSDEAIISAQAQLQAYLGQTKVTKDLIKATMDLATAKKIDLSSAAEMVGKTIGGTTNVLARQGIEIDQTRGKTEKLGLVVQGINEKYKGWSEAQADGYGALVQMKNQIGEVFETIGEKLSPVVLTVTKAITKFAVELRQNDAVLDGFAATVKFVAQVGAVLHGVLMGITTAISGGLGTAVQVITNLLNKDFKQAFDAALGGKEQLFKDVQKQYEQTTDNLMKIERSFSELKKENDEEELRRVEESNNQRIANEESLNMTLKSLLDARSLDDLSRYKANEILRNDQKIKQLRAKQEEMEKEKDFTAAIQLEYERRSLIEKTYREQKIKDDTRLTEVEKFLALDRMQTVSKGINELADLQNSKHKELVTIGRAAAIAEIAIATAAGAAKAFAALAWIPFVGPGLGYAAAAAVILYGAERSAAIAGIQLAEGGIVKATPGGVPAIIGEGGRDEAVIPLDKGMENIGGTTNIILNVYGGMLGDQNDARKFAVAIDRELFEMRRANQSMAFDSGVL